MRVQHLVFCPLVLTLVAFLPNKAISQEELVPPSTEPSLPEVEAEISASLEQQVKELQAAGQYEEAARKASRLLDLDEAEYGPNHPIFAASLNNLAYLYQLMGRFQEAEPLHLRALRIRESHDPDDLATATSLNNLGLLYLATDRFGAAESHFRRSLSIVEKELGELHPLTARNLSNLASVYDSTGRYDEAEPLFFRALSISLQINGQIHAETATYLHNLGGLYQAMGRYDDAEGFYKDALLIRDRVLDPEHPELAYTLNNLAHLYFYTGRFDFAEAFHLKALDIRQKRLGPTHQETATSYGNLGMLYHHLGRNEESEAFYLRSLEIAQSRVPDGISVANACTNLGVLKSLSGELEEGEKYYKRALSIIEATLGNSDPKYALIHGNIASLYAIMGKETESQVHIDESIASQYSHAIRMLPYFGELELLKYGNDLSLRNLVGASGSPRQQMQTQLWFKGMVASEMSRRSREFGQLSSLEGGRELQDRFHQLRHEIQTLSLLSGDRSSEVGALRHEYETLRRDAGKEMGTSLVPLESGIEKCTIESVASSIRPGQALIEFFRYYRRDNEGNFEGRYGSVSLSSKGETEAVDHGAAAEIDQEIASFRKLAINLDPEVGSLSINERNSRIQEASFRLYELLLAPMEEHLAKLGASTLILCGDGQLHFLPFGFLLQEPDPEAPIAAEKYNIRYVSSGRDLLISQSSLPKTNERKALLLTNPAYDLSPAATGDDKSDSESDIESALLSGYGESIGSIAFKSTAGLARIEQELSQLFQEEVGEVVVLTTDQASEESFRYHASEKSVVHLATHGFYLPEAENDYLSFLLGDSVPIEPRPAPVMPENPMFRSGLALAGAQETIRLWKAGEVPHPSKDGMLLASEVASIDLSETDLLFLGACETAFGDSLAGEGVLGLRRALAIAGARNTILTLWPVLDQPTVELTERFYEQYFQDADPATALSETQKALFDQWRQSDGYAEAVRKAAPFVCTSLGPVETVSSGGSGSPSSAKPWWKFW